MTHFLQIFCYLEHGFFSFLWLFCNHHFANVLELDQVNY
ncbi:hypothetical protein yinte0001_8620 [Yersinia intermedia ATCC 29909]|nr:hypothetical protein yinte0001_8620 [Yersinia intermedia ATCC 29909]